MKDIKEFIFHLREFDWDKGNKEKNLIKHKVTTNECEEVFFNIPTVEELSGYYVKDEQRYYALGVTNNSRKLTIIFVARNNKIRVISARAMSRKERKEYDKKDT